MTTRLIDHSNYPPMARAAPSAEPGIDAHTLFKKLNFTPHSPAQVEYAFSKTRFNIPCCGRRWGKSIPAGHRVTFKSFVPDSYNWIVGPTYKLGEKEFRIVWQDYQDLNLLRYCRKSYQVKQGDMRIKTPWGSVIEVASAEKPDSLLGEGLSHACMSEAARHNRATWEQYVEPALSDLRGTADFPSTPKGYNWYHGLWTLGSEISPASAVNPYRSWQLPSWTNPIRFPGGYNDSEIVRIRSVVSKTWFDQEYGAKFTTISGAIYTEFDPRVHVKPIEYNPSWPNFMAFDYGFANPFVALDCQVGPDDTVYVWREYYSQYLSTYDHALNIKDRENPANFSVQGMWGDPRGPDEAATIALILGHVASVPMPWKTGVEQIKRMLKIDPRNNKTHIYIDPSCTNLIRQMSQLHIRDQGWKAQTLNEFTGDRNMQHKTDDHAADALRYFIGPYFGLGMGTHLEDIYGQDYIGSESHDFLTVHNAITLGDSSDFNLLRDF